MHCPPAHRVPPVLPLSDSLPHSKHFWHSDALTGILTGAELRSTTNGQMYRTTSERQPNNTFPWKSLKRDSSCGRCSLGKELPRKWPQSKSGPQVVFRLPNQTVMMHGCFYLSAHELWDKSDMTGRRAGICLSCQVRTHLAPLCCTRFLYLCSLFITELVNSIVISEEVLTCFVCAS